MSPPGNSVLGDDVALDQANIVPRQEEMVLAESQGEDTSPLLKLPPELRVMIYEPLIRAGDLSILRVSKLVTQEAVPLLSKVAILRLNLGHPNLKPMTLDLSASITSSGLLTLIALDYIQLVDLRLNMVSRTRPPDPKGIYCFSGNRITRKSCIITITLGTYASVPFHLHRDKTYRAIKMFTGFQVLLLKLERERNASHEAYMLRTYGSTTANEVRTASISQLLSWDYKKVSEFLQTTLGPADFKTGYDVHFLRFRPSKYKVGTA